MRAVAQRVQRSAVRVAGETVSHTGLGLLALIGVARGDTQADAEGMAEKLVNLRVFLDDAGKMNVSLLQIGGTLNVVSQVTLLGDVRRGRRPSYGEAAHPDQAEPLITHLIRQAQALGVPVVSGRFRQHMEIELINDGPVTLLLDTRGEF